MNLWLPGAVIEQMLAEEITFPVEHISTDYILHLSLCGVRLYLYTYTKQAKQ